MRISTKGRYGLAVMLTIAKAKGSVTAVQVSKELNISKIYLEQVFSALKNASLLLSTKGANGGYTLPCEPKDIVITQILKATESTLFEKTENSTTTATNIEAVLQNTIWSPFSVAITTFLDKITLQTLLDNLNKSDDYMFYI